MRDSKLEEIIDKIETTESIQEKIKLYLQAKARYEYMSDKQAKLQTLLVENDIQEFQGDIEKEIDNLVSELQDSRITESRVKRYIALKKALENMRSELVEC